MKSAVDLLVGAHGLERLRDRVERRRADVRAVRVAEEHQQGLPGKSRLGHGFSVAVDQSEGAADARSGIGRSAGLLDYHSAEDDQQAQHHADERQEFAADGIGIGGSP